MTRWVRRHQLAVAYVLIGAVFAVGLFAVQHEAEERRTALCESFNAQQAVLDDLLDVVLNDSGGSLPLTALPEFQRLDPATQDYLTALEELSSQDDPDDLSERLRRFAEERLEPAECESA